MGTRAASYRITAAGRDALRRSVDETATDGRTYESEPLVRLFFGNVGTKEAMLHAIDQAAATASAARLRGQP